VRRTELAAYFYDPKYQQELKPLLELKDEGDGWGDMQQKTFGVKAGSPEHELTSEMMTKHAIDPETPPQMGRTTGDGNITQQVTKFEAAMKWFCHSWDCAPAEVLVDQIQHS
jgi:hypothetical protein